MKSALLYYISLILTITLSSCGGNRNHDRMLVQGDTISSRADLLTLIDCGDYVAAVISDPWHPDNTLAAYALVPRNTSPSIPQGLLRIDVPLHRSIVYSSTNMSAIAELDAIDAVCAVADGIYYSSSDTVTQMIAGGRLADIGNSMSPKIETLVDLSPDAILVSPYENAGHGVIDVLKVPVIECADYMEPTPLGRAEWILLLGELYDRRQQARDVYDSVVSDYESLRLHINSSSETRPKVITELLTSGVWYVPGGASYMSRLLQDAGASYPWSDNSSTGSLQLDAAAVLDRAADADIWIMRNPGDISLASLSDMSPLYNQIKAFRTGNIYNCNSATSPIFNDIAFHPEKILADLASIFHPGVIPSHQQAYYKKIPLQ